MPEEQIIPLDKAERIQNEMPLFVVEGYIKTRNLTEEIRKIGLINLVLTDSSYENFQFPGCDNHVIRPDIDEDRKRLEQFRKKQIDNVFEIDHVFCSSMEEQRSELEQILKAESLSLKGTAEPLVAESLPILCPSIFEKEGNI